MSDDYAGASLECDIVMKGGITSGVVYPGAVLALAKRYRFKNIGGASAGGIAAALVAAAEHARAEHGFERLAELPAELMGNAEGDSFILQLFEPDRSTRPLFKLAMGFLGSKRRGVAALLRWFPLFPSIALVVAVVPLVLCFAAGADPALAVGGVFAAVVICVVGVIAQIARLALRELPRNHFGLCRLGTEPTRLTGWLHERIQATAHRTGSPLTFGDLRSGPGQVDLQMMTTDLTHGRPMRLPTQPDDAPRLFFDPEELRKFFPTPVVDHLVAHAPALGDDEKVAGELRLKRFPTGPDLPVVVATRMTLSFPVLISAVPLYELIERAGESASVRVLFSDGGITSNFPVHFFDSPLPRRPTFGLDLTSFEPGEVPNPARPCDAVRAPASPTADAYVDERPIESLFGFFVAIKDAMQNWRDNAQASLPGFRDRIVSLKLAPGEGGLNLAMDAAKIDELNARGQCAGEALVELFADEPAHWNTHRFVRYRTSMALLERHLRLYSEGWNAPADPVTETYGGLVREGGPKPYALSGELKQFAEATTGDYLRLATSWGEDGKLDGEGVPRPPSTLRAVPPV
jgi:predicted acylesterase/phospholipase RssA